MDWTWLSEDTALLPQGWTPEFGFLPYKWDYYSELMMIYLLGMGSSSHPLHPDAWLAWKRTTFEYDGERYIGSFAPLFVHQYSQAWFDFRGKRDKYADYFQNSAIATDVHRRFCMELARRFLITATIFGGSPPRIPKRVRDLGRTAGHGADRRNRGSCGRRGLIAISAGRHHAGAEEHPRAVTRRPGAATASSMPSIR